jgi:hypothetical protein
MTSLHDRLLSTVAGQLGRPHGILSPFVARALNKGNGRAVAEIAAALQNSGLRVEHHRIEEKPMPRYTIVGRRL